MRGEELDELFVGYAGVYGDRVFAFESSANQCGFPWFTGRDKREMIRYRARFRQPDKAAQPINLTLAEKSSANAIHADLDELMVDVDLPDGRKLAIDDPALIEVLRHGLGNEPQLTLLRSARALTDARPLSIFSVQSASKLTDETGAPVDKRRFRANVYFDLRSGDAFAENEFVGKSLRIGSQVIVQVLERDSRCMMITLDPDTAEKSPALLKAVAQAHEGMAGVYAAVLIEGIIRKGDSVEILK
jgi:uncharacterized protein YcbX